ncbi:DUF3540 domain-containing protein [Variovorax sp. IB41]|uniref:DUF3540 domain-containing protein n=1 Tax=Variovorax sp. IB41 TaxID=2779370 RepID=UPI0018E864DE|nr:DUF3540 domain-containing protein [Variovorax sp. IB41]MBJ2158891.1 DUF3540 domain-containing protein [Variovorax sp. IB41]
MQTYPSDLTARLAIMPFQQVGVVESVHDSDDSIHVRTDQGLVRARCATSCLIRPAAADRVWLASLGEEGTYVMAVLDRPGTQPLQLLLGRDATIRAEGKLTVLAAEGMAFRTPQEFSVDAQGLTVKASKARFFLQVASVFGRAFTAAVSSVSVAGNRMESCFERLTQTTQTTVRHVEGADLLSCGTADYRAASLMRMHGENVIVTADELVKSDGKQIHFG